MKTNVNVRKNYHQQFDRQGNPIPTGLSKSVNRKQSNSRIGITGNGGRKGQNKHSNSLNHSGILQRNKERL